MKEYSAFNPDQQQRDISSKVVAALERISEVFKTLLWDKAKLIGLSPIQIQILVFIAFHSEELCHVSHLAKEFNVTKPTVSDAIKTLVQKELISKVNSSTDNRRYFIQLSPTGDKMLSDLYDFANPLKSTLDTFNISEVQSMYKTLSELIYKLNIMGLLSIQRMCYACKFYENRKSSHYCNLLEKELQDNDIRIDCPEFSEK